MNKTRFERTSNKKSVGSKGFYIALGVCLIAIGMAAWTAYDSVMEFVEPKENKSSNEINENKEPINIDYQTGNNLLGVEAQDSDHTYENEPEEVENQDDDVEYTAAKESREGDTIIIYPCGKNIVKSFSDVNPVYSKTFGDWRIHNAIDFSAEAGEIVKAVTSGTVKDVYDDPSWGMTVVISHDGDFEAYYSGLGDTVLVKKDDTVTAGQDIGSINDVPAEIKDGSHLHFSVKKGDKLVDPMTILENAK